MEKPLSNERLLEEFSKRDVLSFLDYYGVTNDQGDILDFKDHPYLSDIYSDWTPKQCIKKCAQVGISTTIILKALWACKNKGLDIIYSFPTYDLAQKMVSSKVNRLISNNPVLQEWTKDKDSVEQKRVGKNMLYFQGTMNEQAAIALPADLYIADEVDRSDQKVVDLFSSRLQHSKFKWEWRFSNPSVPENGVDVWWQQSDQKEWFVRCEGCNRDQILTMDHIQNNMFVCNKCGKELNRRKGQWIARWSDVKEVSGYHISSLMAANLSASYILQQKKDKSEQQFTNMILGEPYVGSGNYLPRHILLGNLTPRANPQDDTPVIGVDTGKEIHFVVGNKYGIFYEGAYKNYDPIEAILRRDPRALCVIDQGGDITAPRALQEKFPGRVYLCTFVQSQDVTPKWKEDIGMVNVDRNKLIQLVVDEFTEKRIPLFGNKDEWTPYADHWSHLFRVLEEDERGRRKYIWQRNGPDHLALATCYWRIGMDKISGGDGELIMPGQSNMFQGIGMDIETGQLTRTNLKKL